MTPPGPFPFRMTETLWRVIILALSGAVLLFSVWCLTHGITTIFMHLYYFPIVLLAYRYRWKGFGLATLLALAYLGLVMVFDAGQWDVIIGAVYRFLVFVGIAAVIAYLSEQLAIEKRSAQESTELRDQYLSLAPAIVLALDRNGAITYLNRKGCEILECVSDEVAGKPWIDLFLPEKERERVTRVFSQLMAGQVDLNRVVENPILTRGGTEKIIRWHNTVLNDEDGVIAGVLGFGEDITEEKRTQDTLRKMQQFQESVITNANVWISVLAPDGSTILVWNDAAEAISGYKKSDVMGKKTVWKLLYPDNDYRRKVTGDIQRIIGKDEFLENFETQIRCADGTKKTIVWNTRGLMDDGGSIVSYIAIGRDITKQIQAESEIRHLASFPRLTPVNILESDLNGRILFINPAMENTLATLGISDPKLFIPADSLEKAASESPGTQPAHQDRELVIHGRTFTLNLSFVPESRSLRVYATDITDRKRAEDALKESEQRFRDIFNNVNDAIQIHEMEPDGRPGRFLDVNDVACHMLMISREELLAHNPLDYATEYHNPPMEEVTRQLRTNGNATFETGHRRTDGIIVPVEISAHVISLMEKTVVLSVIRDLTSRKKVEEEIRISNMILRTQQETSPDGILIVDDSGKIISFNHRFTEIWGIPQDVIDSRSDERALSFVLDKLSDPQEFLARVRYLYEHREEKSHEEIGLKDGKLFERYSAPMLGEKNHYFGRVWYFHDITERKRTEEERERVRLWQEGVNRILESVLAPIPLEEKLKIVTDGVISAFGADFCRIWVIDKGDRCSAGCMHAEVAEGPHVCRYRDKCLHLKASSGRYTHLDGKAHARVPFGAYKIGRIASGEEDKFLTNDVEHDPRVHDHEWAKSLGLVAFAGYRLKPHDGEVLGVFALFTKFAISPDMDAMLEGLSRAISLAIQKDIVDEALRGSRQLFADIISFLPDPTFVIDKDGKVLAWNRALEQFSGVSSGAILRKGNFEYSLWMYGKRRPILIDLAELFRYPLGGTYRYSPG
jgi:PAS domain S-box-containing protein